MCRSYLLLLAISSLATPVLADGMRRVVVHLPLPPAALAQNAESHAPATEALASLSPQAAAPLPVLAPPSAGPSQIPTEQTTPLKLQELRLRLARGQSLYYLFKRHGLSQADLLQLLASSRQAKRLLSRLRPGQKIDLWVTGQKRVEKLMLKTAGSMQLQFSKTPGGYRLSKQPIHRPEPQTPTLRIKTETPAAPLTPEQPARAVQALVKPGDSLYLIFRRYGVSGRDLARLMAAKGARALKRLRPGQRLELQLGSDKSLLALRMQVDETLSVQARRTTRGFNLTTVKRPLDAVITTTSATIESSLFLAGQRAGLSDPLIMQMVDIFGWDVDFALDIRAGDRFTVIYQQLYRDGKKIRDGHILAAEFFNRGRSLRALRYQDTGGRIAYYSPTGLSMRKAFLRTPVSFARISSRFNLRRKHPVLNRIRAHKGVDYAAPRGTPIKAAGDGRVVFAGWKRGYGNTIILQHGSIYSTLYGHMSRLHKRARRGQRVYQGQIIGYVGQTGLATGPHLHYEFRVRGVHKDPLKVKLPKALPIDRKYKANFLASTKPLLARLNRLATTSLAGNP